LSPRAPVLGRAFPATPGHDERSHGRTQSWANAVMGERS
jgi:hypothetical protein